MSHQSDIVQLEQLTALTNSDAPSHVPTRWERKMMSQAASAGTDKGTPTRKRVLAFNVESPGSSATPSKAAVIPGSENTPAKPVKVSKLMTPSASRQASSDRFIPTRASVDFDSANYKMMQDKKEVPPTPTSQEAHEYKRALADTHGTQDSRVLAFKKKAPVAEDFENPLAVLYTKRTTSFKTVPQSRVIPNAPEKILDAPDLINDFYISPLDWSCANQLGVALGPSVYLWNAASGAIGELCTMEGAEYVSSVRFVQEGGGYVAVGTSEKNIGLWDVETSRCLRTLNGHSARVSSLAWNQHVLTSAGRDATIVHHDVRVQNHIVGVLRGHTQEVCSLAWSHDGTTLASGSNDNSVCIWDAAAVTSEPRLRLTHHQACVKAMAWNPHARNVLVTGGGTSDRTIRTWSTVTGVETRCIDTGSQVCSLQFNPNNRTELLSSHGFSENQLTLWKFPDMTRIKDLTGHTSRVLHTAVSPDGTTVCSASADETLRMWKCFGSAAPVKTAGEFRATSSSGAALRMSLR